MSCRPLAIATDGYLGCPESPPLAIASSGYLCLARVLINLGGGSSPTISPKTGAEIILLAVLAVMMIEDD